MKSEWVRRWFFTPSCWSSVTVWLCDCVFAALCSVQRVVPGFRRAGVSDGSPGGSEGHHADHLLGSAPAVHRGPLQSVGAGHHAHRQPEEVNARPRKLVTSLVGRRCRASRTDWQLVSPPAGCSSEDTTPSTPSSSALWIRRDASEWRISEVIGVANL